LIVRPPHTRAARLRRDIVEIQIAWQRGDYSAAECRKRMDARYEEAFREVEQDLLNEIHD
jgi:hypothetical protein